MPRMTNKKEPTWITAVEGAAILAAKGGPTNDKYIRRLAARGDIESWKITTRQSLYSKEDIEGYALKRRTRKTESTTRPHARGVRQ